MPRRVTLTDRQKDALLRLPTSQTDLLKHYTLSDEDLGPVSYTHLTLPTTPYV